METLRRIPGVASLDLRNPGLTVVIVKGLVKRLPAETLPHVPEKQLVSQPPAPRSNTGAHVMDNIQLVSPKKLLDASSGLEAHGFRPLTATRYTQTGGKKQEVVEIVFTRDDAAVDNLNPLTPDALAYAKRFLCDTWRFAHVWDNTNEPNNQTATINLVAFAPESEHLHINLTVEAGELIAVEATT